MSKTIIITGGGGGVGRATAQHFLANGWQVGLIGRRSAALEETAAKNKNTLILPCDVTDETQVESAFNTAYEAWGRLDAVFNNAGVSLGGAPIDELSVDERSALKESLPPRHEPFVVTRGAQRRQMVRESADRRRI